MNDRQEASLQAAARGGDLFAFHEYYMGREPWELHRQIFDYLITGIDPLLIEPPEPTPDRFVGIPPGFGKSTIIETVIVATIVFDRNFRWILGSKASTRAVTMARNVRDHLEYNGRILRDFGTFKGDKWTEAEFQVSGRDPRITHPSVRAIGTDTSTLGSRADGLVGDDLLDLSNTGTEHMRRKFREWWTKIALSRLDPAAGRPWPYGCANVIGNILHRRDEYNAQIESGRVSPFLRKAYVDEARTIPTLPELFDLEALDAAKRRLTDGPFEVLFMLNLKGAEGVVFSQEWARWWTSDPARAEDTDLVRILPSRDRLQIFQGWDLAGGEDASAGDFVVGVTLGREMRTGRVFVMEIFRKRVDPFKQLAAIIQAAKKWDPIRINIEKNFAPFVAKSAAADPWIGRRVNPLRSSGHKIDRVRFGLQPIVQRGDFHFRENKQQDAEDEFFAFPDAQYDDVPDAIEIALRMPPRSGRSEIPVLTTEPRIA